MDILGLSAIEDLVPTLLGSAGAATAGEVGLDTAIIPSILSSAPAVTEATLPEIASGGADILGAGAANTAATAIPGILQGTASASPESIAASEQALAKAPYGIDLSSLTNSQAIDPTLDAAARQSGLGAPGVDLSSVANSQALNPSLSGAATSAGLGQGVNLSSLGYGNPFMEGASSASDLFSKVGEYAGKGLDWAEKNPMQAAMLGVGATNMLNRQKPLQPVPKYSGPLSKYHLASNYQGVTPVPNVYHAAQGGIMSYAPGGPAFAGPATTPNPTQMYPQSQQVHTQFAVPSQMPTSSEVLKSDYDPATDPYTGDMKQMAIGGDTTTNTSSNALMNFYKEHVNPKFVEAPAADVGINKDTDVDTAAQDALTAANTRARKIAALTKPMPFVPQSITPTPQLAQAQQQAVQAASGGIMGYSLGGYAAGKQPRLLKGPGDGMSDNIPATIADRQPARLADGEFVVPADVVSHLGNGSTDAGAKKLHGMMDKVRVARTGKKAQSTQIKPDKYLPA
jgi:hypothetical protein